MFGAPGDFIQPADDVRLQAGLGGILMGIHYFDLDFNRQVSTLNPTFTFLSQV
jgi:hypothetical protein